MSLINVAFGQQSGSNVADAFGEPKPQESEALVEREAKVDALTRLQGTADQLTSEYEQRLSESRTDIRLNGTEEVERNRARQKRLAALRGATSLDGETIPPEILTDILSTSANTTDAQASEQLIQDSLQDLALATETGDNREVLEEALNGNEAYDFIARRYEDQQHQAALMRMAEEAGLLMPLGHEGLRQTGADFLHMGVLGLTSNLARGSDVIDSDEDGGLRTFFDSGQRWVKNVEAFRNSSKEEQITQFPALLAEIKDNLDLRATVRIGGLPVHLEHVNRSISQELIMGYVFGVSSQDAALATVFDGMDTVPTVGGAAYGTARLGGRTVTMSRLSGAKKAAQELLVGQTQDLLQRNKQPSNPVEYVDETSPAAVNPNSSNSVTDIPTEGVKALDVIEQMDEVITLLQGTRNPTELLDPASQQTLLKEAVKGVQKELKRKVLDVRIETVDQGGVSTPVGKMIVGNTKDGGYKTPLRMLREAKKLGIDPKYARIRDNNKFDNSRVLSAEEAVQETVKQVERPASKYDVRPNNDSIFDAIRLASDEIEGLFLNPTKAQLDELADMDIVQMLATPEGNTVAWLGNQGTISSIPFGVSRADVGQGFYNPKSPQSFDPANPLDSIHNNFTGADGDEFNLRRTNAPAKPDEIKALEDRYDSAVENYRQTEKKHNFLTTQTGGGEKLQKKLKKSRTELDQARKELENTSAALDEAVGHRGEVEVVQKDDGLYYLELEVPFIDNKGFVVFDKQSHITGPFARWLLSNNFTSDINNLSLAGLSEGHRSAFLTIVRKFIAPQLKKLQRREKRALDSLATRMRDERRWYTDAEVDQFYIDYFGARNIPQRWRDGVEAYRTASDLEYYIRNSELYNRASIAGFQTVGIDFIDQTNWTNKIEEQNAKLHRTPPSQLSEGKIYDAATGELFGSDRPYDASQIGAKGDYIVEFQDLVDVTTKDGAIVKVKHIVANREAVYARGLERAQLPYIGGGSHIIYGPQVRTWVKQAQTFTQGDGSGTILMNPRTYIGGTRPSDVQEYVTRMNDAIDIAKRFYDPATESQRLTPIGYKRLLGQVLDQSAVKGLMDRDTFMQQVENHQLGRTHEPSIDIEHKLEIVDDRQNPSLYDRDFVANENEILGGHESWARTNGRTYYGPRGQRMLDAAGQALPVLDPFSAMDRALNNVARIAGMSNYQARTSRQFLNTFGDVLAMRFSNNTNPDVVVRRMYQHINDESLFRQSADPKRVTQAKNQLASVGRIANWDVPLARNINNGMISLANKVDAMAQNNILMSLVSDTLHWSMQAEFTYGLRQAAFDMKLGLGNIAQLPMQISTAIALTSVDPKATAQAFATYPMARVWLYGNPMDGTLNGGSPWSVKQLRDFMSTVSDKTGLSGQSLDNWVSMMDSLRNSDFLNLQGHTLQGDMSMAQVTGVAPSSIASRPLKAIRDLGRISFNEAEIFNRIVGYQVAWRQMSRRFPNADRMSEAFQRNVIGMADELTLNMRHHARAANQSGIASGFTQFMAYPSRWIEMMFSLPGNNSYLTRFQRSRFILSQLPLYGYGGFWLTHMLSDWLKKDTGQSPSFAPEDGNTPDSVTERAGDVLSDPHTLLERGALDAMYYIGTGQDHRYADRAEVASFLPQLFSDFTGNSKYGDTSAMEFLGGASVSIALDTLGDAADVMWAAENEGPAAVAKLNTVMLSENPIEEVSKIPGWVPITGKEITELLRNVSSVNNYMRYQGIKKTGELRSKNGRLLADDLNDMDAISALWGIPVQEQDILSAQMEMLTDRSAKIDTAVADAQYFIGRYQSATTPEARNKWLNMYAHYLEFMVPDQIRGEVAERSKRYDIESMLKSTSRRVQEIELGDTIQRAAEEEFERRRNESESN